MIKWNEVTWYSKLGAALVLFGVLPVISFYIGYQYKEAKEEKNRTYNIVGIKPVQSKSDENLYPIKPSGETGLYTKEDALKIAHAQGVFLKESVVSSTRSFRKPDMSLEASIKSGVGMAWVIQGFDTSQNIDLYCGNTKNGSSVVHVRFEMNEKTGVVDINKRCGFVIIDF